jgi:hypothetical protein
MTDLLNGMRVIGDGPNPFAPKPRTLPSVDILRVLGWDPNDSMDHGRIRAIRQKLESVRGMGGPTQEQRLMDWALQVEPKRPSAVEVSQNPARLPDWKREPRALSAGEIEFLRSFEGVEPSKVPTEDVQLLAKMEASAESEPERRAVARVLNPMRRLHDRREEEAELRNEVARHRPSGWRCPTVRQAWEPVLAERLAEEARAELEPQLTGLSQDLREKTLAAAEEDARREAQIRIRELWGELDAEAAGKVRTAQARLSALALGANPVSSATNAAPASAGIEEGRRRGREAREAREVQADAFAGFRKIG